jgi:arsenate reductase-like glutaredoxin family protein
MTKISLALYKAFLISLVLTTAGCGSVSVDGYIARLNPPSEDKFISPVDFANAYGGGKDTTTPDGIRLTRARMCGVAFGAPRKNLYLKGAAEICIRQGGVFQRPLCMDKNEDSVIFVADTPDTPTSSRMCNRDLEDFDVVAFEPVPAVQRREFTALIKKFGYKTKATIEAEAETRKKTEQNQLKVRMEQQASLLEVQRQTKLKKLPLVRKIGAQICQRREVQYEHMKALYVGNVEGITDDKIQIRISRAYFESNPSVSLGGFSQSIIWDSPMNWDLCE